MNKTAIINNQTFSPISAFVKPEKLHPVDLICTILLILGVIPFGLIKLNAFFHEICISNETRNKLKKKREKRNLFRKARIAKEIGVEIKDLNDYRIFFVGLDDQTSSGEERSLIKRYRKDYGDKGDLLVNSSSENSSSDDGPDIAR